MFSEIQGFRWWYIFARAASFYCLGFRGGLPEQGAGVGAASPVLQHADPSPMDRSDGWWQPAQLCLDLAASPYPEVRVQGAEGLL